MAAMGRSGAIDSSTQPVRRLYGLTTLYSMPQAPPSKYGLSNRCASTLPSKASTRPVSAAVSSSTTVYMLGSLQYRINLMGPMSPRAKLNCLMAMPSVVPSMTMPARMTMMFNVGSPRCVSGVMFSR